MRTLQVQFVSGREVLSHYWGLLSGGGLAIPLGAAPKEPCYATGDKLHLQVHVASIKKSYQLDVQVLEVRSCDGGMVQLMVSFLPGAAPEELLDAAWADGCDAPQRRSRRLPFSTPIPVRYERLDGHPMEGRTGHFVNLSTGGCCVEGTALPPPGTQVLLTVPQREGEPVKLVGRVRWTERPDGGFMGIEFLGPAPDVQQMLQSLLQRRPVQETTA